MKTKICAAAPTEMNAPEILAPAGSQQALEAAVRAGADAVYLGGTRFSARQSAENFGDDALKSAVAYCHMRGVRVYLAENTLLYQREIPDALKLAETACEAGVDAFIVQDIGLADLLRKACAVPLHASTQLTVHSPAGILAAKKLGFTRAVLARELTLLEIREISAAAKDADMELEVFVHGALCMSVSGQCYLSALIGRRSGNRGMCAQPCRLPYNGEERYPLSLKDLCGLDRLAELAACGVHALKIEGRMKRPEYVAAATHAYRLAADGKPVPAQELNRLRAVFSRAGFTDGYLTGNRSGGMFGRRRTEDKLESSQVLRELHDIYRRERQSVPVTMRFTLRKSRPAVLSVSDGEREVQVTGSFPEEAKDHPLKEAALDSKLRKTGGTPYFVTDVECKIEDGLAYPAVATLKQEALSALSRQRMQPEKRRFRLPDLSVHKSLNKGTAPKLRARFERAGQIPEDPAGIDFAYLPLECDPSAASRLREQNIAFGVELPRVLFCGEGAAYKKLEIWKQSGASAALCHTVAALELSEKAGIPIHAGAFFNLYQTYAAKALRPFGVKDITLSFELTLSEAKRNCGDDFRSGIVGYGYLPAMLTRICPLKNEEGCKNCGGIGALTDRTGARFAVKCRGEYTEIYHSRPIWMADRMGETEGLDFITFHFTSETPSRCRAVLDAYKSRENPPKIFTRGLYFRGVI